MPSRPPPPPADLSNPLPPPPKPVYVRHHQVLISTAAGVAAAVVVSIFAAVLLALLLYRRFSRGRPAPTAPSDLKPLASPLRRFSYSQLRRATVSFSPSHKLGQGGFGPVFRGTLPSGQEIAVKVMDSGSLQGEREFQNELALAGKIVTTGSSPDRGWVVAPLGFCCDDRRSEWWWWKNKKRKGNEGYVLLLVYELMHNGSLQDALLDRRCPELLDWGRRFSVAVDIARALQFLHVVCDPPVIHGDIKPSNILLDLQLNAKIADFGLARLKASTLDEDEIVVEIDSDKGVGSDLKSPKRRKKELAVPWEGGEEDDASVVEEAAESMTTGGLEEATDCLHGENGIVAAPEEDDGGSARAPPEVDEMVSPSGVAEVTSNSETGGYDRMSLDSGKETTASGSRRGGRKKPGSLLSGKDWWWRQDNGGGGNYETSGGVKDYVMEWIKSEIKKERPKSDWIASPSVSAEDCLPRTLGRSDRRKQQRRLEWWASLDEERLKKKEKSRPAREWWREEFCEELTKKQRKKQMIAAKSKSRTEGEPPHWWNKDEDCASTSDRRKRKKKNWSRGSQASMDWWVDGLSGEMRTTGTARRSSQDWASGGEIPKSGGTISSTPSMRGTVCYVAPEYGGGGPLSEKCDIYSFGVLLLVLISGRRPLQVTASPMSEFERANLISWARHLAYLGRLLELIDPTLRAVDKNQALLCITVALLCIQRSPARRPSVKEIVGMLTGQSEPPHLPLEFSPSPPGGFSFKSRKKAR